MLFFEWRLSWFWIMLASISLHLWSTTPNPAYHLGLQFMIVIVGKA